MPTLIFQKSCKAKLNKNIRNKEHLIIFQAYFMNCFSVKSLNVKYFIQNYFIYVLTIVCDSQY